MKKTTKKLLLIAMAAIVVIALMSWVGIMVLRQFFGGVVMPASSPLGVMLSVCAADGMEVHREDTFQETMCIKWDLIRCTGSRTIGGLRYKDAADASGKLQINYRGVNMTCVKSSIPEDSIVSRCFVWHYRESGDKIIKIETDGEKCVLSDTTRIASGF